MAADRRPRRTDGCTVLLVEDNDQLRLLMRLALESEAYVVDDARSAEDGLLLMEDRQYDLVLTDFSLPGNTGGWLLREAVERGLLGGAATLVLTAESTLPAITGDPGVIVKPVDLNLLLPQIRAILGAGLELEAARAMAGAPVRPQPARVELVLYVSPHSASCARAERAIRKLLEGYDSHWIDFQVRDVSAVPDAAANDRIVFTPTLLKRSPPPGVWVLGELSNPDRIAELLHMSGVRPSRAGHAGRTEKL